MSAAPRPSVRGLWVQAGGETPDYNHERFLELMHQHGHLLKPGDHGYEEAPKSLPCGRPNRSDDGEGPRS